MSLVHSYVSLSLICLRKCRSAASLASWALLRVAAAEHPSIEWGGADVGPYHSGLTDSGRQSDLLHRAAHGDVFGRSLQVTQL